MPTRDLHEKPFDEGTKTKLAIYRSFVRAWLQVFLHADRFRKKPFQFFDFFAGPGEDGTGQPGSPLILVEELLAQRTAITKGGHDVRMFFNDADAAKIAQLKKLCAARSAPWQPAFESLAFTEAFRKVRGQFGAAPAVVFIDQNGLKHVTPEVFHALTTAQTTDFLFFTASSFKRRFGDLLAPEISIPNNVPYSEIHRALADAYRQLAPKHMFIGHFSIKKDSNIYGLVFGSHHWRGMQKFLEIVWALDPACGEADYEIESDTSQGEMYFDEGRTGFKKRKTELFQEQLTQQIKDRLLATDADVFLNCITNGFLPRVARDVYKSLRQSGAIKNAKATFPRFSDEAMKAPRRLEV